MKRAVAVVIASLVCVAVIPKIGLECKLTDHEDMPDEYRIFWKRAWSTQWVFRNPAYTYFDLNAYDRLEVDQRAATDRFCEMVYGTADPALCYARMRGFYGEPVG